MNIVLTDVVTEYGDYYQNQGQGTGDLYAVAMREFVTQQMFSLMITRDTVYKAAKSTVGSLVQPFQKGFTPRANSLTFEPVQIVQHHMKVDDDLSPDDLMPSWFGFLAGPEVKRSEWPFVRWFLEQKWFPKIGEDIELNEIGRGTATAPTTGTAGPIKTSMDGLQTIVNGHIAAGRTEPINMGAIPENNVDFVLYMEDFVDQIHKAYWRKDMTIYLSEDLERRYLRGHFERYGDRASSNAGKGGSTKIEFTNQIIKGIPSMNLKANDTACNRILCTPKENAVMMMNKANPFRELDMQPFERIIKLLTDWYMGIGFILPEIVFCNDQQ